MNSADGARSSDSTVQCLDGVRVVEMTTGIVGPYAARFLADQGADVVKVEPPSGDPYRSDPGFQAVSRNKHPVVPQGVEWERAPLPGSISGPPTSLPGILRPTDASLAASMLSELLVGADVVFVPDGPTAAAVRNVAAGAVIISCPTWGDSGPYATRAGTPSQIAAVTGIGWNQISYSEGPVELVVPLASYGAGMLSAMAAAAGLYARRAHGSAPTYTVSEVSGSGGMQIGDFEMPEMAGLDRDGSCPLGSAGRLPVYRLFRAADHRWMFVACGTLPFYVAMLRAIGREDLLGDERFPNPPWGLLDLEPLAEITPILEDAFAARPLDEWLKIFGAHDVPCQPTQTREEFTASPLAAADVIVENFRPGVAERLGCSDEKLRRIRPDAVLVKSPGYGRDESMADVPAFDPLLHALGGIMAAQGGADEPVFLTVPVHDAATPMIAAFGVLCSLFRRLADGEGRTVRTSLTQTVMAAQAAEFVQYLGRPPTEAGGMDCRGAGPERSYLEVADADGREWVWHETTPEGTSDLPAERRGFVGSEVARSNGHVVDLGETEWGPMNQVGSLIGGIGVTMRRAPFLDEHRTEIEAE